MRAARLGVSIGNPESDSAAAGGSWLGDAWLNDEGQVEADEAVGPLLAGLRAGKITGSHTGSHRSSSVDGEVAARDGLRDVEWPREKVRDVRVP